MLTLLDLLAIIIVALAAIGGWRVGGSVVAARLAGLVVGFVAGLWAAGLLSESLNPVAHLVLGAVCVIGGMLLGSAAGRAVGRLVAGALRKVGAGVLDRALGAVARAAGALIACWIVAALAASFGPPKWGEAVRSSALLTVNGSTPVTGPVAVAVADALRAAAPDDLAAQLSAEIANIVADTAEGDLTATALVVDQRADLAVLRIDGLSDLDPLPLAGTDARNGSDAVVVG